MRNEVFRTFSYPWASISSRSTKNPKIAGSLTLAFATCNTSNHHVTSVTWTFELKVSFSTALSLDTLSEPFRFPSLTSLMSDHLNITRSGHKMSTFHRCAPDQRSQDWCHTSQRSFRASPLGTSMFLRHVRFILDTFRKFHVVIPIWIYEDMAGASNPRCCHHHLHSSKQSTNKSLTNMNDVQRSAIIKSWSSSTKAILQ